MGFKKVFAGAAFSRAAEDSAFSGNKILPHADIELPNVTTHSAKARQNKPVRKAILPVGGLGTRFLPVTKALPKEMLPVVDKPLVQYVVEEAIQSGIEDIIFVTGRGKSAIEDHFDHSFELEAILREREKHATLAELSSILPEDCRFSYTRQRLPLGLGHAIYCARALIGDEPFAVLLADDIFLGPSPCLKQLLDLYDEQGGNIIAITEVNPDQTDQYGIIRPGERNDKVISIKGLIEKPDPENAPSHLAISGRYILQPEIFDVLANVRKGVGGEIQLTDALAEFVEKQPFYGLLFEGQRFDCGSRLGFLEANIAYALERDDLRDEVASFLKRFSG